MDQIALNSLLNKSTEHYTVQSVWFSGNTSGHTLIIILGDVVFSLELSLRSS